MRWGADCYWSVYIGWPILRSSVHVYVAIPNSNKIISIYDIFIYNRTVFSCLYQNILFVFQRGFPDIPVDRFITSLIITTLKMHRWSKSSHTTSSKCTIPLLHDLHLFKVQIMWRESVLELFTMTASLCFEWIPLINNIPYIIHL
jgi:hypothetical protein